MLYNSGGNDGIESDSDNKDSRRVDGDDCWAKGTDSALDPVSNSYSKSNITSSVEASGIFLVHLTLSTNYSGYWLLL